MVTDHSPKSNSKHKKTMKCLIPNLQFRNEICSEMRCSTIDHESKVNQ